MRIAIYSLEPKYENTALMQISMFHKLQGDSVEWYSPLFHNCYGQIYCSGIFDYSNKDYVTPDMICGGPSFNFNKLPEKIARCNYDYSIYPNCTKNYLWFSRGCINTCPYCVVPKIEGKIRSVEPKNLNPNGKVVYVMDANFFANPSYEDSIDYLKQLGLPVSFQQGIDARIFTDEHGEALNRIKLHKYVHTAWDNPRVDLTEQFKVMIKYVPKSRWMVYVLIGYWSTPEEDIYRVKKLKELGLSPYIMPYNKKEKYQKDFARWINGRTGCEWEEYNSQMIVSPKPAQEKTT